MHAYPPRSATVRSVTPAALELSGTCCPLVMSKRREKSLASQSRIDSYEWLAAAHISRTCQLCQYGLAASPVDGYGLAAQAASQNQGFWSCLVSGDGLEPPVPAWRRSFPPWRCRKLRGTDSIGTSHVAEAISLGAARLSRSGSNFSIRAEDSGHGNLSKATTMRSI